MKRYINPDTLHETTGYSHAIRVGNTVYVAGQVAMDKNFKVVGKGDIEAQTVQAFENLKKVLKAAGAKMSDVVKLNIFCTDYEGYPKVREIRKKYFPKNPPVGTGAIVKSLALKELMVEIEAVAVID